MSSDAAPGAVMPLWQPKQLCGVFLKRALMWHDAHGTLRWVPVSGNPVGS